MSDENINEPAHYFCTECGLPVEADDKFCSNCGANLSVTVEYNPDEPVLLKIFPRQTEAKLAIINLDANKIKAYEGLKSWSQSASETAVYVRNEDLQLAQEVLKLMANKPKPMQLGDIFSSSFTVSAKTLKRNIIIAAMLIPAGILLAYSISTFFGSFPSSRPHTKIPVSVETPAERIINYSFISMGLIDSNLNAVMDIDEEQSKMIKPLDKLWVNFDSTGHREFRGFVSTITSQKMADDTALTYKMIIKFSDPDKSLLPGAWCETEVNTKTPKAVLSLTHDCMNYSDDMENEEDTSAAHPAISSDSAYTALEYVYIVADGKAKAVEVTSGVYDDVYIEIVSGLSGGEKVVNNYYGEDDLKDGAKVFITTESDEFQFSNYAWPIFLIGFAGLLCGLIYLAINIGITKSSLKEMEGESTSVSELFRTIFSSIFTRCIALFILIFLMGGGIATILFLLIGLGSSIHNDFLSALGGLLFIPAFFLGIYFYIRWYFSVICIIDTGATVTEAMKNSSFLVKGYWWRTFGIILLISIAVNFMVSLITTPLSFIFMWDYISSTFSSSPGVEKVLNADQMKSLGFGLGLSFMLSYLLEALILPVFNVVMYFDLKLRKNDYLVKLKQEDIKPELPFG